MRKIPVIAASVALLALAARAQAADVAVSQASDAAGATVEQHRYLVTTKHTAEQCLSTLDDMAAKAKKTLGKMQWGCMAGDHTGYMFVTAPDADTALKMLPPSSRDTAKAVELTKFTPRQLKAIHTKMDKAAAPAKPAQ